MATTASSSVAAQPEAPAPSDEQIIGLEAQPEAVAEEPEAPAEEPTTPAEAKQPEGETERAAEETPAETIPQDARTIPAELREAFKANPKLRDAWFAERAYREVFPTVKEARELKQLFPGGLEDAQLMRDASETLQHFDGLYVANSPEAHGTLADELFQLDAAAAPGLAIALSERWHAADPEGYRAAMSDMLDGHLSGWIESQHLPEFAAALSQALNQGDADAVKHLAAELVGWAQKLPKADGRAAAKAGPDPELQRLRDELAARDAREAQERDRSLQTQVTQNYVTEVREFLTKSAPTISEGARNKIVGEVINSINKTLMSSPHFMARLNEVKASGDVKAASDFILARARQMLPQAARTVLNQWTTDILAANKTTVQKKAAAAGKTEAAGGGAPRGPAARSNKIDYAKMSDADILGT